MRSRFVWAAAFLTMSLAAASSSAQFSTDTCTANSIGRPCTYGTCVPGVCDATYEDGGSFHGSCVLCASLPGPYCPAANVGLECHPPCPCEDADVCQCSDAGVSGVCLTAGVTGGGGGASASADGGAPGFSFSESYAETYCGWPVSEDGGAGPAYDSGVDSSTEFLADSGATVGEPSDAATGDASTRPVTSAEAGSNPFAALTDTCTSNSVGQACSYGTCVPGQCTSSDPAGDNFSGACVVCVSLPGPYCPAAEAGQACKGGGTCTASDAVGGGGSGSSSGGGWSTMSVSYDMTWCGDGTSSSGSGSGGFSSSGTGGGSGSGSGGLSGNSTSGSSGSSGGSSGGSSNGVATSSGSGSGTQGGTPRSDDAGSGQGKGGTGGSDAGKSGTSSGAGHAATDTDAGAGGAADNGGDRETATGLACSMSKGTTGSSRLGFLAVVGLAVAVWRRRRSD